MANPYFDPKLKQICLDTIRNMLTLYFEFAFKLNKNLPVEYVAFVNAVAMEVEDSETSAERLVEIYELAVRKLDSDIVLKNFCRLPLLFLVEEMNVTSSED